MCDELTPSERAAVLARLLTLGWKPTTAEVALRFGIPRQSASRLLAQLSRVMPLAQMGRRWVMYMDGAEW